VATLEEVAAELYGLAPEDFTATRNLRAKEARAAGDRELADRISALRRPSAAAWAVNLLVRAHPAEVEQLLRLGDALREAQEALAGDELRELNRRQHGVIAAIRRRARTVAAEAGHPLSESVGRQVEATLRAAMADPAAAAAVRSGALTTDLESTGFGSVDVDGAVADVVLLTRRGAGVPADSPAAEAGGAATDDADSPARTLATPRSRPRKAAPRRTDQQDRERDEEVRRRQEEERHEEERRQQERRRAEQAKRVERARREMEEAERAAEAEAAALARAEDRVAELARQREDLSEQIEELTKALHDAQRAHEAAGREHREARQQREATHRASRVAARAAAEARERLDRLG
jgi:hypothetical protein